MNRGILDDFKNAWDKPNNAVAQIILLNVIMFIFTGVLLIIGFGEYTRSWLGVPSNLGILIIRPWTLITHAFVHADFFHILFNMLWFYWFGRIIQEFLGSDKVIAVFTMGVLGGILAFLGAYNIIPRFNEVAQIATIVGASAGVTAAVIGAAVYFPNYTMFLMFIGPVKIKYIALVSVFLSLIGTRGTINPGGEFAHLGGALMGWLYMSQLKQGNDIGGWITSSIKFVKSLFKPQPKIKVTHRAGNRRPSQKAARKTKSSDSSTSQSEIDAILDKISDKGYESLTKAEKQKLFNASKK
ncbi:MAG: rhomboid family intramembrane serine protease [Ekhidna sp.]|nr:rhomboid family intramembrane serine protease [Ekhidna sp.]